MKKTFKLQDLDCANCAAKMERAIAKLEGVQAVGVNFMTQRLTVEAADEQFAEVMDRVVKTCAKVEPDCKIIR